MQEPQAAGQFFAQNLQYLLSHLRMLLAECIKTFATQGERDQRLNSNHIGGAGRAIQKPHFAQDSTCINACQANRATLNQHISAAAGYHVQVTCFLPHFQHMVTRGVVAPLKTVPYQSLSIRSEVVKQGVQV